MVFCKINNPKTLHFYSIIIIIIKIFLIGSILWRAKENKLLSGSNLFPHMMWIKFSWRTVSHSENWEEIISRESLLAWVQQQRQQPGKHEIVRPAFNQREHPSPAAHRSSSDLQHIPKVLQPLQGIWWAKLVQYLLQRLGKSSFSRSGTIENAGTWYPM